MPKKFLKLPIFIILVLISLLTTQAVFFSDDISSGWQDFKSLPDDAIDIAFIGNSHNRQSFDERIISDLLGQATYVAGTSGEGVLQTEVEIDYLCKTNSPLAIIIESYVLEFEATDETGQSHLKYFFHHRSTAC